MLRLFNYSVSCLLVILYSCCNIDSYFWRREQTRRIIWLVFLHNSHHRISPSDLWIKPWTLWEIQGILILSPNAGEFTTSSVSYSRHLLPSELRHLSFISNLDFSGFITFQDLHPAVLKAQQEPSVSHPLPHAETSCQDPGGLSASCLDKPITWSSLHLQLSGVGLTTNWLC